MQRQHWDTTEGLYPCKQSAGESLVDTFDAKDPHVNQWTEAFLLQNGAFLGRPAVPLKCCPAAPN